MAQKSITITINIINIKNEVRIQVKNSQRRHLRHHNIKYATKSRIVTLGVCSMIAYQLTPMVQYLT